MGSRSSTRSSNQTQEIITNNNDNRVAENGSIGGNVNVNLADISSTGEGSGIDFDITSTDFGAIEKAATIAEMSIASNSDALAALKGAASSAISAAESVAANATRDEGAKTVQIAVIGGAIVFAIVMLIKRR